MYLSPLPFPFDNHNFAFYICDSISVLWIAAFLYFLKFYIFVFLWLTSLSMIISMPTHVAANDIVLFFMAK